MNTEVRFVFASGTQNAVRRANFALSHVNASRSHSVSDVAVPMEPNGLPSSPALDAMVTVSRGVDFLLRVHLRQPGRQPVWQFGRDGVASGSIQRFLW